MRVIEGIRFTREGISGGCRALLDLNGIYLDRFVLPIAEGQILNKIIRLGDNSSCVLHVGCYTDVREPSIVLKRNRGFFGDSQFFEFRYERTINIQVLRDNDWFDRGDEYWSG